MQMLPFWVVKFFPKLHSTASIFGIDKERVELLFCWSACVFQIHTSKQMLPTLQLFYLFIFYFFFLHIIKRKFSIYSRNNLTSSINFFNTTRADTDTCTCRTAPPLCWKRTRSTSVLAPRVSNHSYCHRGSRLPLWQLPAYICLNLSPLSGVQQVNEHSHFPAPTWACGWDESRVLSESKGRR